MQREERRKGRKEVGFFPLFSCEKVLLYLLPLLSSPFLSVCKGDDQSLSWRVYLHSEGRTMEEGEEEPRDHRAKKVGGT